MGRTSGSAEQSSLPPPQRQQATSSHLPSPPLHGFFNATNHLLTCLRRAPRTSLYMLVTLLALLLSLAAPVAADTPVPSARAHRRVLVLLDELASKDKYSLFWSFLKGRGHTLDFKQAGDANLTLETNDIPAYENLILFSPKSKTWGPKLDPRTVVEFVKNGGNIIVSLDTGFHESWRAMAYEFGLDFDNQDTLVIDHFKYDTAPTNANASHTRLATTNVHPDAGPVLDSAGHRKPVALVAPVLYEGIGHRLASESNPLVLNVLKGESFSYTYQTDKTPDSDPLVASTATAVVSVVQSRNNARAMFTGSLKLFSDEFCTAPVRQKGGSLYKTSGNAEFVKEITRWVFQEKGVLRIVSVKHNKVGMHEQPADYRIKDNMTYTIELEEFYDGEWHPFVPEDAQLEVRMLDPYIRRTLQRAPTSSALTVTLMLPDVYGVFTLRVNFKRPGLSYIVHSMTVPLHPFRHNEYPRFLSQAYPYYASAFSMAFGFLAVSMVWLFHSDRVSAPKEKKRN